MSKASKAGIDTQVLLLKEIKQLNSKIDALDARLSRHISFIESVYAPLSNSIDKFKKLFK